MKKTINRQQFLKRSAAVTAGLAGAPLLMSRANRKTFGYESENDKKFVSIFDGKSLDGWHKNGGRWSVESGAIISEQEPPRSGEGGILLTDKKYRDFELIAYVFKDCGCGFVIFLRFMLNDVYYDV